MKHHTYFNPRNFCALILVCILSQASPNQLVAEELYENPVIPGDHPDPSIIRTGKDYWATSTSSEWGPQFPLLHSTDLVNWEQVGEVFSHRPDWAVANFWAPEISEFKGRYFVYYVGRQKDGPLAVAVAVAEKPDGPYKDYGPIVSQPAGSIDPVPCTDESGRRYLVWKEDNNSVQKPTVIWAQPLDADGTKLTGKPTELIRNDADWEGPLVEGPFVLRHGDWYYLFYSGNGCCGRECHYGMGVARSHSILGPWEKNPANPILAGNDTWKCPGHGSIVADEQGRYWLLYHAYSTRTSIYTGREAMLDEVKFAANGWPTINEGRGPSVKSPSPFGAAQKKTDSLAFNDSFKSSLQPGWQWPQNNEPVFKLDGGHLVLAGRPGHSTSELTVLARSTLTGDYTAMTEIDQSKLAPGVSAGLAAIGDARNAIGISVGDHQVRLWTREKGSTTVNQSMASPRPAKVYLKMDAVNGVDFHFAASVDGKIWVPLGDKLTGVSLPPWDRSLRVALTVEGAGEASAQFDSFNITPATGLGH